MPTNIPREINLALAAIQALREVDPEMPTQMAHVFLAVANKPSLSTREIMHATGLSQSSVSRATQTLGAYHRTGKAGLGVIEGAPDPRDTRAMLWSLTPKGVTAAANIVATIRGEKVGSVEIEVPRIKDVEASIRKARLAGA